MKRISLRQFRDTVADLAEVVEVQRRDPQGNHQVLGYWTPYVTYPHGASPLDALEVLPPERTGMVFAAKPLKSKADVGAWKPEDDHRAAAAPRVVTSANPPSFRPVPKPARKK